ncbi:MAG TPA: hypothetical protein VND24_06400, partial [Steroidobacteraceae bacterium]|nr:hypothetical protein [Steroidobacteraceae bacterium]
MAVVVAANLIAVLASRDARAGIAERRLQSWLDTGEELHGPALLRHEVAHALTRLIVAGRLAPEDL